MLNDFVGLPWRDGGRSLAGCDCWGLCVLAYGALLRVDLPSYAGAYATAADRDAVSDLIAGGIGSWREVAAGRERVLDAVLMTEGGVPRHIGLVALPGKVLHMPPGGASLIEPYTTGKLRHRIAGFFRHEAQI